MSLKQYGKPGAITYLEGLLGFTLRANADTVADALIKKYGTIDRASAASIDELMAMPYVTEGAAILLRLAASLTSRRVTERLAFGSRPTEEELRSYLVGLYLGVSVETVYLLLFDEAHRFISLEYMGEGTVSSSDIYPRRLLECALRRSASSAILVHNHPRANDTPSIEDVSATYMLYSVFRSAGMELLDHYVVSDRSIRRIPIAKD